MWLFFDYITIDAFLKETSFFSKHWGLNGTRSGGIWHPMVCLCQEKLRWVVLIKTTRRIVGPDIKEKTFGFAGQQRIEESQRVFVQVQEIYFLSLSLSFEWQ